MDQTDSGRVILTGHIDVPDDRVNAVRAALPAHIALTRQEDGCISFEVVEHATIPGRFMVSEIFATQAAFDAHQARTKASEWFQITQGIPRDYSITVEQRDRT